MLNELLGEFIGTTVLIYLGLGINAGNSLKKSKAAGNGWLMICMGWGLAVTMGVFASGNLSPAHLNPAVSFAFALTRELTWSQFFAYSLAQVLGAMFGAILVWLHYKAQYDATADPEAILATFSTSPEVASTGHNLFSEIMGTFILVFLIMMFGMFDISAGLNPLMVGLLITVIGFGLGGTTGFAINPARDLAPRIIHAILPIKDKGGSDWAYAWIPVVGPIIGGALAAFIFMLVLNLAQR